MFAILEDDRVMSNAFLYESNEHPLGRSWEEWATLWCKWMLSIPKKNNPSLDETGKCCSINQNYDNVWFLTGTFGNVIPIIRKCDIPQGRSIFFPVLEKEDSFAEDSDLRTDSDLIKRCRSAIDKVVTMEAKIDGYNIEQLENYRFQSRVFDLKFPEDNVYDVKPGLTRSVCDGYWVFIKPLPIGRHLLYFRGENSLAEPYTITQLNTATVFNKIRNHIQNNSVFKLEVLYELTIID